MPPDPTQPFWKDLFRPGGFAWSLRMRKGDAAEFFAPQDERLRTERLRWLEERPEWSLVNSPAAEPLVEAAWDLAEAYGHVPPAAAATRDLPALARLWEPDLIFYDGATKSFAAACVCLPSSWDPRKWVRRELAEVHDVVPQLQRQVGAQIDRFLDRLEPGRAFRRENWSLSLGGELNFHPALHRPPLDEHSALEEVHLRVEHQIFTGLPGGVMMGIRIRTCPLLDLSEDPEVWAMLAEKLRTMPDDVARYKNLLAVRDPLVREMEARGTP